MKKVLLLLSFAILSQSCETVPITGRKRMNFVSDASVLPMSFAQYAGFLKENKVSTDATKSQQIKDVGLRISKAVDRFMRANDMKAEADSYRWEFNLIDDETVNAWCMPGGKVVFYTGILPICANEDGIAAVMGHEVAHAFAKHGQERMSHGQLQQIGAVATQVAVSGQSSEKQAMIMQAYGVGSQVGVMLPFSRKHESEADRLGLVFMIMAGYDGKEAAEVWVRMSQRGGEAPPEILSTHPSNQSRIAELRAYLPTAKAYAKEYNAKNIGVK